MGTTRPRQMCTDSESNIRFPLPNLNPPLAPFDQSCIYVVDKRHSGKADQLTLANGGREYIFSVQMPNQRYFAIYDCLSLLTINLLPKNDMALYTNRSQ